MGRMRLRKSDRVKLAGKKSNKAQYVWGITKRKDKVFGSGTVGSIAKKRK